MSKLKDFISEGIGSVIGFGFIILTIWGIGWSFYRHGAVTGIAAVFVPPYAWYRGVAAIWEDPQWKEDYEEITEVVGTVIALSLHSEKSLEIIKYKDGARKWIRSLPENERERFRVATESFGDAYIQYERNMIEDLTSVSLLRPITDPSVRVFVERFSHEPGLMSVWKKIESEDKANRASLEKKMEDATFEKRLEMAEYRDVGVKTVEANAQQIRETIDELFRRE